jgi:predicted small secreted protein
MRVFFLVCAVVCLSLAGCEWFRQAGEEVQRTGHSVNLMPTADEAGWGQTRQPGQPK